MLKLEDLLIHDEMYYLGHLTDMDSDGWVDKETAELFLLEYNSGVTD